MLRKKAPCALEGPEVVPYALSIGSRETGSQSRSEAEDITEWWEVGRLEDIIPDWIVLHGKALPRGSRLPETTSCAICIKSFSFFGPGFSPEQNGVVLYIISFSSHRDTMRHHRFLPLPLIEKQKLKDVVTCAQQIRLRCTSLAPTNFTEM